MASPVPTEKYSEAIRRADTAARATRLGGVCSRLRRYRASDKAVKHLLELGPDTHRTTEGWPRCTVTYRRSSLFVVLSAPKELGQTYLFLKRAIVGSSVQ
jgi:hypothetical protein